MAVILVVEMKRKGNTFLGMMGEIDCFIKKRKKIIIGCVF